MRSAQKGVFHHGTCCLSRFTETARAEFKQSDTGNEWIPDQVGDDSVCDRFKLSRNFWCCPGSDPGPVPHLPCNLGPSLLRRRFFGWRWWEGEGTQIVPAGTPNAAQMRVLGWLWL